MKSHLILLAMTQTLSRYCISPCGSSYCSPQSKNCWRWFMTPVPNQWGEWVSRYLLYVNLKNKLGNTSSYWGFVYCPALYPPNLFKHTQSFQTFPFLHIFGPALATVIWTYFKPRSENTKDQLLTQLISHYSGNQTLRGLNISSCKPMHSCAHKPQFL